MNNQVIKAYGVGEITPEQLAAINRLARREMRPEELYVFSAVLCDNQIDRQGERFSGDCLRELAALYVGVTGIFDHDPRGSRQTARIFATEVVEDPAAPTNVEEPYLALRAEIYMVRSAGNADLILEIDGGIKKEISVGCVVRDSVCSVCGSAQCSHERGRRYEGSGIPCHTVHRGGVDAYEWSFVAVPAQPRAGVVKGCAPRQYGTEQPEELRELAELGRRYRERLTGECLRLCRLALPELDGETVRLMAQAMSGAQLQRCNEALQKAVQRRMPLQTQLGGAVDTCGEENHVFRL